MAKVLLEDSDLFVTGDGKKWGIVVGGNCLTFKEEGGQWVVGQESLPDLDVVSTSPLNVFQTKLVHGVPSDTPGPVALAICSVQKTLIILDQLKK